MLQNESFFFLCVMFFTYQFNKITRTNRIFNQEKNNFIPYINNCNLHHGDSHKYIFLMNYRGRYTKNIHHIR